MRKRGGISKEGKTLNWFIGHGLRLDRIEEMRQALNVRELTPEQSKLSIVVLAAYSTLIDRIVKGWTPERDEELAVAARRSNRDQQDTKGTPRNTRTALDHYLYFPQKSNAVKAAERLKAKGWAVEVRMGADGENWLALAKQPMPIDEEITDIHDELDRLARELHGEYDGWGAPV
jgi:hypothetical protein